MAPSAVKRLVQELIGTWVVVAQFAEQARVDSPDVPR